MFQKIAYRTCLHADGSVNPVKSGWFLETWMILAGGRCAMLYSSVKVDPRGAAMRQKVVYINVYEHREDGFQMIGVSTTSLGTSKNCRG
jgi:hypothetical protein